MKFLKIENFHQLLLLLLLVVSVLLMEKFVTPTPTSSSSSSSNDLNNGDIDDNGVKDFTNYKVIRLYPKNDTQLYELHRLEHMFEMDYWNELQPDLSPVLTIVDPQKEHTFFATLNDSAIRYQIITTNYQEVIERERAQMFAQHARVDNGGNVNGNDSDSDTYGAKYDYLHRYHTYEEIRDQLQYLAQTYSSLATYVNVGQTYENRQIPALMVGKNSTSPVIFIECGIHSREWVSIALGTWIAQNLVSNPALAPLVENYRFIVVPVLNVDGFVHTYTANRLWRKTRSRQPGTNCVGADPNRNWDAAFCKTGASNNPCQETYCGRSAFSEVEAAALSRLIAQHTGNIAAYFAVHSFSQLWMYPYGYTSRLPSNADQMRRLSVVALNAIKATHGLTFKSGPIARAIYPASGSSIDWAYDVAKATVSFAIEMRDKGTYGFQLPPEQIKPAIEETWAGIKAVIYHLT